MPDCADLGHLEFLPSGDAALTRRATKASRLSAVVVRWSTDVNAMSDKASWRKRRRSNKPHKSASPMPTCALAAGNASRVVEPIRTCASAVSSPPLSVSSSRVVRSDRAEAIALHAAARGSGRVGRSAAGQALERDAVRSPSRLRPPCRHRLRRPAHVGRRSRIGSSTSATVVSRTSSTRGATVRHHSTSFELRKLPEEVGAVVSPCG